MAWERRLLAVAVLGAVSTQRVVAQSPEECAAAAIAIDFDVHAYERYNEFFTSESVMQQSQAGKYTGPASIFEYVSLAVAQMNPFLIDGDNLRRREENSPVLLPKPSKDGLCEFLIIYDSAYGFSDMSGSAGYVLQTIPMFRMFINPRINKITRINVFYTEKVVDVQLGILLGTPEVYDYLCNTMRDSCSDVWRANGLNDVDQCVQALEALPNFHEPGKFADGNSSGCRTIHSVLAANNTLHCPHISFVPIADDNGAIKCQVSDQVPVSDLFEPADVELWRVTAEQFGVPSGLAAWGPPCTDDADCKSGFICTTPEALDGRRLLFSSRLPGSICVYDSTV